jgi:hypothetical protein
MQDRTPTPPEARDPVPDFDPVPRRHRCDGWTPDRQRAFINALAELGSVSRAAKRINMSPEGAYYLRRQPGAETFRAAWNAALDHGVQRLTDIAIDRATDGVPVPIFWRGEQVGEKRRYNDRLLMFILRHHQPERYGANLRIGSGTRSKKLDALEAQDKFRIEQLRAQDEHDRLTMMLSKIRTGFKRKIADDPAKRAAWELLVGPTDWDDPDAVDCEPHLSPVNMHRPDMIIAIAAEDEGKDEED